MEPVVQSLQAAGSVVQPMPPLADYELDALRADIAANGVLVSITVDQHGRIIDGNNRAAIAAELGLECPRVQVDVDDDDAAIDLALRLNCARRHLSQEQVRDIVRSEIARRPQDSDRSIARRVGCSPTTVGTLRKTGAQVSNLDSKESAEARTQVIRDALEFARLNLAALAFEGIQVGVPRSEIVMALTTAQRAHKKRASDEAATIFAEVVYGPVLDAVLADETPGPDLDPSPELRALILDGIAEVSKREADE